MHSPTVSTTLPLGWIYPYTDAIYKGTMHLMLFQVISALPSPRALGQPSMAGRAGRTIPAVQVQ